MAESFQLGSGFFLANACDGSLQSGIAFACGRKQFHCLRLPVRSAQQDGLPGECALSREPMQLPRVHAQQDGDRLFVVQYQILVQEHSFCIGVQPWILDGIAHMSVEHVRWNVPALCLIRAVMLLQPLVLN